MQCLHQLLKCTDVTWFKDTHGSDQKLVVIFVPTSVVSLSQSTILRLQVLRMIQLGFDAHSVEIVRLSLPTIFHAMPTVCRLISFPL